MCGIPYSVYRIVGLSGPVTAAGVPVAGAPAAATVLISAATAMTAIGSLASSLLRAIESSFPLRSV
ncbi:hypothetical protein GCM10010505_38330 [Kitasatospora aburaviensis]